MGHRRFEVFQDRQLLVRLRAGDRVRKIARAGSMGRNKLGELRAVAARHGWLDIPSRGRGDRRGARSPGDFAQRNEDGSITLLGRSSVCIDAGRAKVFHEAVEDVRRRHPHVAGAACVGVPDERFGQAICARLGRCAGMRPQHPHGTAARQATRTHG